MPYLQILEDLVRSVRGAEGALLLDSEGEVVVQAGSRDFRHRLIGAYQGIALHVARRIGKRHGAGEVASLTCRYAASSLVVRPLKDGYFLVLSVGPAGLVADAERRSDQARTRLDEAL